MELVHRHWSGKHHAVVDGINLITLLWSEGEIADPVRLAGLRQAQRRHHQERALPRHAPDRRERGFTPECVLFDSWYASVDNLRLIRRVRLALADAAEGEPAGEYRLRTGSGRWRAGRLPRRARSVHLEGYGLIRVFRVVATDGETEYWATNDLAMGEWQRLKYAEFAWGIEVYHRALKQECEVERAMVRAARAQRNHIGLAIRAFVRLEWHRLRTGISWGMAKAGDHSGCGTRPISLIPGTLLPATA